MRLSLPPKLKCTFREAINYFRNAKILKLIFKLQFLSERENRNHIYIFKRLN